MNFMGFETLKTYWQLASVYSQERKRIDDSYFQALKGDKANYLGVAKEAASTLLFGAAAVYSLWLIRQELAVSTPGLLYRFFVSSGARNILARSGFFAATSLFSAYKSLAAGRTAVRYYYNLTPTPSRSAQNGPNQADSIYSSPEGRRFLIKSMFPPVATTAVN